MRVRPHELSTHLQRQGIAPIYLISGDEPLQMNETADTVRSLARQQGYSEREVLEADARFDWNILTAEANSLSLFAEKRIIDLRIPSGKPGREGGKALAEYAARPPEDTLLLVTLLAGRIEGNLLAAAQEIDKLQLLYGNGVITLENLQESVADSARYDVYGLVDAALAGRVGRSIRILNGLKAEGTAAPVVLWALTREIRLLCTLAQQVDQGRPAQQVVAAAREVWDKRKPLVGKGLQRLTLGQWRQLLQLCCVTDRAIKGQERQNPWLLLQRICTTMAGAPALH